MLRFTHRPRTGVTMNAPLAAPLLSAIEMAPRDPILGVSEAFHADPNPNKVNLGVGVYYDDNGKVPLLECVRRVEHAIAERGAPHVYLPIDRVPSGAIVVLHACCHNPTGVDPSPEQWGRILEVVRSRGHVPFLDLAYQGLGESLDADGSVVRRFAATPGPLFVSSSFSKSFSLYGERVGALSIVAAGRGAAIPGLSPGK